MLFPPFTSLLFVLFCEHYVHLAPLCLSRWLPNCFFSLPNYALLATKIPLFYAYFALFGHVFNGSKRVLSVPLR